MSFKEIVKSKREISFKGLFLALWVLLWFSLGKYKFQKSVAWQTSVAS